MAPPTLALWTRTQSLSMDMVPKSGLTTPSMLANGEMERPLARGFSTMPTEMSSRVILNKTKQTDSASTPTRVAKRTKVIG